MDILDLWSKPASYNFNEEEISFIKSKVPKKSYRAKYAIYKKDSPKGCPIAFILDSSPGCPRKSGYLVQYEVICERYLTNIEYQEIVENFGTNNRRFHEYLYRNIEQLQIEDKKYYLDTPEEFVRICKERGLTGDVQLKMFDSY